ncbi:DNA/RNA non-specific endonuclease [Marivirga salinae]|uniref:Endonuclease n=1 Tax=Marivirga salinarum TaxID=3059078 RepID=A0AA51NB15_9BACT|nr:DNA/RNA non-specific endonuclease [Marivirga sp. BDSF4-3]WMN11724.1 DNA/RNA non-specific endonuclease [Marivirga sp. BDSF4-3]
MINRNLPLKDSKTLYLKIALSFVLSIVSFSLMHAQEYLPATSSGQVVHHAHYSLSYSEAHEQAEWVYYELTAAEARNNSYGRSDNFREDYNVKTGSASLADYKGSGYDRGHLAPAGDMGFSSAAMSESFYMSNMSPQDPSFNRGIWRQLESLVRSWSTEKAELFIATGPVLENGLSSIGYNEVSIPKYYYKVLLDYDKRNGSYEAIGFLLPNRKGHGDLADYVVFIDQIEKLTGFDFYSQLADSIENNIEARYDPNYWNWKASKVKTYGNSNTSTAIQCKGNTQKGARCRNRTKNEIGFCYLHESQADGVSTEPATRATSVRCSATTNAGTRCKRKTKSANGKCWQHGDDG